MCGGRRRCGGGREAVGKIAKPQQQREQQCSARGFGCGRVRGVGWALLGARVLCGFCAPRNRVLEARLSWWNAESRGIRIHDCVILMLIICSDSPLSL
jgi:hypothetical protein